MKSNELEPLNEIAARLTLLEFALEVLFAREMASLPSDQSKHAKAAFLDLMSRPYGALTGDMQEAQQLRTIADRSVELAERFVHKVTAREATLRTQ